MDKKIFIFISLILLILFAIKEYSKPYELCYSKKVNCDILLNKKTGETWFNSAGYWEKCSKDIVKE